MSIEEIAAQKAEEMKAQKAAQEEADKKAANATPPPEDKEPIDEKKEKEELPKVDAEKAEADKAAEAKKLEDLKKDPEAVKKRKEEIQKDIDRLKSEQKALEYENEQKKEQVADEIAGILEEMDKLKAQIAGSQVERELDKERSAQSSPEEIADQKLQETIDRFIDQDKGLDRSKRREMTKEELDEFLIDDYSEAQQWLVRREIRRDKMREDLLGRISSERSTSELVKKQQIHIPALLKEFPDIDKANQRVRELRAQGKEASEVESIVRSEVPDYALLRDIVNSDPKFRDSVDAPLLTMQEMKKRKANPSEKKTVPAEDADKIRQEAAEAERQRQAQIDAGINSTRSGEKKIVEENLSEFEKKVLAMAASRGVTKERIEAAKARRTKYGFGHATK